MVALIQGSRISSIFITSGRSAGLCSSMVVPSRQGDLVDHRGGGGDQVEIELAGEALLDDFEMQQAQEAAAEAEAEGGRWFPSRRRSWHR